MSPRKYPPLTPREVEDILTSRGFVFLNQHGSHRHFRREAGGRVYKVTVDTHYRQFDEKLVKSMIRQSGLSWEEFYGATGTAAKKVGLGTAHDKEAA